MDMNLESSVQTGINAVKNNPSSPQMHRSTSMPVKPAPLETRTLKRSEERETIYVTDYYPESPCFERRKSEFAAEVTAPRRGATKESKMVPSSLSETNFPCLDDDDWCGSTIELNTDEHPNDLDPYYNQRRTNRVIEKNGHENVVFRRIPEKSWRYMRDVVTTLVRSVLSVRPTRFFTQSPTTTPPNTPTTETVTTNTSRTSISTGTNVPQIDEIIQTNDTIKDKVKIDNEQQHQQQQQEQKNSHPYQDHHNETNKIHSQTMEHEITNHQPHHHSPQRSDRVTFTLY